MRNQRRSGSDERAQDCAATNKSCSRRSRYACGAARCVFWKRTRSRTPKGHSGQASNPNSLCCSPQDPTLELRGRELQLMAEDWRSPTTASLAVRVIRPCLKWAEKRDLVQSGTAVELDQLVAVRARERCLSHNELQAIWPHLEGSHGCVMKWLLWTGCRLNEAVGMKWGEIADGVWTIPATRSKNGRQKAVPLPKQALELLDKNEPSSPDTLVFPTSRGTSLGNWHRVTKRLQTLGNLSVAQARLKTHGRNNARRSRVPTTRYQCCAGTHPCCPRRHRDLRAIPISAGTRPGATGNC
jgi:hypothetical protein